MENDLHINEKLEKQKLNELLAKRATVDPNDEKAKNELLNELIGELVMNASFIAPVDIVEREGETEVTFRLIKSPKGENYFPVFTSTEDLELWKDLGGAQTVRLDFDNYAQLLSGNGACCGFVVNPFSDNFRVERSVAMQWNQQKQIIQNGVAHRTVTNESDIKLFTPDPFPAEMSEKLCGLAADASEIKRVWLQGITLDGEDAYLAVVELDGDKDEIFKKLGNGVKPFLNGVPVHFVEYAEGFGEEAVKDVQPIYPKSE